MADSNKGKKENFFVTVREQFKKTDWPKKESVFRQSVAVTAIAIVVGILITVFDFLIQYGVNFITQ